MHGRARTAAERSGDPVAPVEGVGLSAACCPVLRDGVGQCAALTATE
jgi:hypothetical protein